MPRPSFLGVNDEVSPISKFGVLRGDRFVIGVFFEEACVSQSSFACLHSDQIGAATGQSQLTNNGNSLGFFVAANLNGINRKFIVFRNFKPQINLIRIQVWFTLNERGHPSNPFHRTSFANAPVLHSGGLANIATLNLAFGKQFVGRYHSVSGQAISPKLDLSPNNFDADQGLFPREKFLLHFARF